MNITDEQKARLANMLADVALDLDAEPQRYSGRGMHGAQCLSIRADDNRILFRTILAAAADAAQDPELEDLDPDALIPHRDSMGLGEVWYWPALPVPQEVLDMEEWRREHGD